MIEVEGWPDDLTVVEPHLRVLVNGREREAVSVSVRRELGGGMPASVIGGSGIVAATGTIDWGEGQAVTEVPVTPWDRRDWPPTKGARVQVFAGPKAGVEVAVFTGRIADTSGSLEDGDLSSAIEDDVYRLNRLFTQEPLLAVMPGIDQADAARRIGLGPLHLIDQVLRRCGWQSTPRTRPSAVVSAPMIRSLWPEKGELLSAVASSGAYISWLPTRWGLSPERASVRYRPSQPVRMDQPLEVSLAPVSGTTNIYCDWAGAVVRLSATSGTLTALAGTGTSGATVCTLPRDGALLVTLRATREADGRLRCELRTPDGRSASGTVAMPSTLTGSDMTQVRVSIGGVASGLMVQVNPDAPFGYLNHTPSALYEVPYAEDRFDSIGLPAFVSRNGLGLLREIAEAQLAALWIDAAGVFRWRDRSLLTAGSPVARLTTDDDVLSAPWSDSADHVRSEVTVTWMDPQVNRTSAYRVTVWQGDGGTMDPSTSTSTVIHPDTDEAWLMVDTVPDYTWDFTSDLFETGRGSWVGGVLTQGDQDTKGAGYVTGTIRQIDHQSWVVQQTSAAIPAGQTLQLRTSNDDNSLLTRRWRNTNLPLIRAKARLRGAETATIGSPPGPADAEVLTHDAGWWIQTSDDAKALADYLAAATKTPAPTLGPLSVTPDLRLGLADLIEVDDRLHSGLLFTGLIAGTDLQISASEMTLALDLRVYRAQQLPTLGDHDTVWAGATLADDDQQWAGHTLADFDSDPLDRQEA